MQPLTITQFMLFKYRTHKKLVTYMTSIYFICTVCVCVCERERGGSPPNIIVLDAPSLRS